MTHPGIAIRAMREAVGLSLLRLAELAGKDSSDYLAQVELGKRTPSPEWEHGIKEALAKWMGEGGTPA